jgi:phosphate/phosphite/phosphonate ABC transporter binding protein
MLDNKIFLILILLSFAFFIHCQDSKIEKENLDFSVIDSSTSKNDPNSNSVKIAIAAMTGPEESYKYYKDLNKYIENLIGEKVTTVQRKTYQEVNNLLANNKVDVAFVCSGGYVEAKQNNLVELLVVPMINKKVTYQSYLIVSKNSSINDVADLKGKVFAFTDPLSNTGCLYPKWLINNLGFKAEEYFSKTFYTHSHDKAIQAVSQGVADGASVDGLIYNYIEEHQPNALSNIKIIQKSQEFGIPPVVVATKINPELKKKLKDIFLNMNNNPKGQEILKHLGIDQFVIGNDTLYSSIRLMASF